MAATAGRRGDPGALSGSSVGLRRRPEPGGGGPPGGRTIQGAPVQINGAVLRRLIMAATDLDTITLTEPTEGTIRRLAEKGE